MKIDNQQSDEQRKGSPNSDRLSELLHIHRFWGVLCLNKCSMNDLGWSFRDRNEEMVFMKLIGEYEQILIRMQKWRSYKNPSNISQFRDQSEMGTGKQSHLSERCV
jgi:hypothetical protein